MPITLPTAGTLTAGKLRSNLYSSGASSDLSAFALEEGHYETPLSWETLIPVAPRPYTEYTGGGLPASGDAAKHVYTHWVTDTKWRVPIGCIGGSFPYIYELVGAPSGMVVTQTYTPTDWSSYGWIEWDTPVADDYTFTLRIIDQVGNATSVAMALNVADGNAKRLDPAATGSDSGDSWANAHTVIGSVFGASITDKIVIMRGVHTAPANFHLDDTEAKCWVGDPEATAATITLSDSSGEIALDEASVHQKALLHLIIDNAPTGHDNPKQVWLKKNQSRSIIADINFTNADCDGVVNGDQNDNLLTDGDDTDPVLYVLYKNLHYEGFGSPGNGAQAKMLDVQKCLMEDISHGTPAASGSQAFIYLKHGTNDCTVRLARSSEVVTGNAHMGVMRGSSPNAGYENRRVVFEYCSAKESTDNIQTFRFGEGDVALDDHTDNVFRRCTTISSNVVTNMKLMPVNGSAASMHHSNNVGVSSDDNAIDTSNGNWTVTAGGADLVDAYADRDEIGIDTDGTFTSTEDANYGKKGWEIA